MSKERVLWKGVVAGAVAGLGASLIMSGFQVLWTKLQGGGQETRTEDSEDATQRAAEKLSEAVANESLSREEKKKYGPYMHYAFGTAVGALYGGMVELAHPMTIGWGTAYGTAVFLLGDEVAVPALGLSEPPQNSPLSTHLYAWASHLVYGSSLESGRRMMLRLLGEHRDTRLSYMRARERSSSHAA